MSSDLQHIPDEMDEVQDQAVAEPEPYDDEALEYGEEQYDQYRTLSVAAVAALIFGVLSLVIVPVLAVFLAVLVLPVAGTVLGAFAVWSVFSRPDEFTGKRIAVTGLGMSALMLLAGIVLNYQLNKIEVPEEYVGKEVYFWELQPEEEIDLKYVLQMRGRDLELPLPERAKELDGQKVFITGYVYPGEQKNDLKKFVMVRDMGTCCFGGQPKLTDMIEVTLDDPLRIDYSRWRRGIGGTLRVHKTMQARNQLTGVVYQLEADYLSEGPGVTGSSGS